MRHYWHVSQTYCARFSFSSWSGSHCFELHSPCSGKRELKTVYFSCLLLWWFWERCLPVICSCQLLIIPSDCSTRCLLLDVAFWYFDPPICLSTRPSICPLSVHPSIHHKSFFIGAILQFFLLTRWAFNRWHHVSAKIEQVQEWTGKETRLAVSMNSVCHTRFRHLPALEL